MLFFKPPWVTHEVNKPIFSVDIHPKGGRFATGGQGGSGGRVVIWNMSPVVNDVDEFNLNVPKMLCQMDNHLACVNVVRWSMDGNYLASGGDDKLVMIWRLSCEGPSSIFGAKGLVNVETWKCVHTLNAHAGDILDLAWSHHDVWLASGSVDNTVIIWNARKLPEKIAVLRGHTGLVKGVTWDPVGTYVASQSDDKSLRIWRTSDWTQQELVTEPFVDSSATTHVLRLSWSPDGQYLVSAHAMNGGGPTAQIIERDGWKHDKDFVGHRKAITCVRFNSNILKKTVSGSPKTQQCCCCAIGSRDRSISVWLTSLKRPLVVIRDLFDDSVLDISWSRNGLILLACSWDGSLACVMFDMKEIGVPLSVKEKNVLFERVYHKSLEQQNFWDFGNRGTQIVENPEILTAIEQAAAATATAQQQPNTCKSTTTTAQEKTIDTEDKIVEPPQAANESNSQSVSFETPSLNSSILVPANKQTEIRLPSGKRRITPMLLVASTTATVASTTSGNADQISKIHSNIHEVTSANAKDGTGPTLNTSSTLPKVSTTTILDTQVVTSRVSDRRPPPPGVSINQLSCAEVPGDQPIVQMINIIDPAFTASGSVITKYLGSIKIQVTNNRHKTSRGPLSCIEVYKNKEDKRPQWDTYLGSVVRCMTANRHLLVVCCEDLSINCYDIHSGARSLLPILIDDVVSCISMSASSLCLVLTKTGLLYMWCFNETPKCILYRISVRSLLNKKGTVSTCFLCPANMPVLTLTDGRAYSYAVELQTWVQLSNPLDALNCIQVDPACHKASPHLPLASLQSTRIGLSGEPGDTLPSGVTLSFLENQVCACVALQSPDEYKYWLMTLINHLLEKGPECRLRLILERLMDYGNTSTEGEKRLGGPNRQLLQEILDVIKIKLPWQRLYREFYEQLNPLVI